MPVLKYTASVFLFFFLVSGLISKETFGYFNKQNDTVVLEKVMENSGVEIQTTELTYSGLVGQEGQNDIKRLKQKIEQTFSIKMEKPKKTCCSIVKVQYNGEKRISSSAVLKLKLVGRKNNNGLSTFLLLNVSINKEGKGLIGKYNRYLQKNLIKLELNPTINTSIKGTIKKRMDHDDQYVFLKGILKTLNGKVIEDLNEENVISLSGYSEQLTNCIFSKEKKINIQIASRYDSLNKQTIITIGNPIISMSY